MTPISRLGKALGCLTVGALVIPPAVDLHNTVEKVQIAYELTFRTELPWYKKRIGNGYFETAARIIKMDGLNYKTDAPSRYFPYPRKARDNSLPTDYDYDSIEYSLFRSKYKS